MPNAAFTTDWLALPIPSPVRLLLVRMPVLAAVSAVSSTVRKSRSAPAPSPFRFRSALMLLTVPLVLVAGAPCVPDALLPTLIVSAPFPVLTVVCLLYTSDAADERSSVDLGGRRI